MSFCPVYLFPNKSVTDVLFSYPDMHSFNVATHAPVEIIISFKKNRRHTGVCSHIKNSFLLSLEILVLITAYFATYFTNDIKQIGN